MRFVSKMLFIVLILNTTTSFSQRFVRPFQIHNFSPLVHFFDFSPNPGGVTLSKNEFTVSNYLSIANNASGAQINKEIIYLDGEMYRNELLLQYGLLSNLELSVKIPFVRHTNGFLDPMIDSWHESLNLPGTARKYMKTGRLNYFLFEEKFCVFNVTDSKLSLGDISMSLGSRLFQTGKHALAVKGNLKFANADKKSLIGSGTVDVSVQLAGTINPYAERGQFTFFYSLGFCRVGNGALLAYKKKRNVGFGSLGIAFAAGRKLYLKSQLDFHSSLYKYSLAKQLGKRSAQLAFGLDYRIAKKMLLTGAFVEDIIVNTAPDFVLHFGVSYQFK